MVTEEDVPEQVLDAALSKRLAFRADAAKVLGADFDFTGKSVADVRAAVVAKVLPRCAWTASALTSSRACTAPASRAPSRAPTVWRSRPRRGCHADGQHRGWPRDPGAPH